MEMEYRRLGGTGLKVSVLSFGSWVTFGPQLAGNLAEDCLAAAYEGGVNFFDNAEGYEAGRSETIMGEAIRSLGWPRYSYVVSTKLFWGLHKSVNMRNTLNRKYLSQAIDGSLERMGLDFVDLVYCHRPDPDTPVEETVWAMSDMITAGKALYWGTSEWPAETLREAWDIAERHHLHKPVVEQPQYRALPAVIMSDMAHTVSSMGVSGSGRWQYTRSTKSRPIRSSDPSMACMRYLRFRVFFMLTSLWRPQKSFVETT